MIEVATTQHSGKQQCSQQDALWNGEACVQSRNSPSTTYHSTIDDLFLAVADGVAVSPFPHLASRFVIDMLAQMPANSELTSKLVREIHGQLCDRYAQGRTLDSSTTLVAAKFAGDRCQVVNVGDSRAYRITANGDWSQLSHDHTILNELRDEGQVLSDTESAALCDGLAHCFVANHEEDHFATHYRKAPWLEGDCLLLCSDGLHDTLGDACIQRLFNPEITPLEQIEVWRQAVLSAGAPDNFSIILAKRLPTVVR